MFVLFKIGDYAINLILLEENEIEWIYRRLQRAIPPAAFLRLGHVKRPTCPFKLSLVLRTVAGFFLK